MVVTRLIVERLLAPRPEVAGCEGAWLVNSKYE